MTSEVNPFAAVRQSLRSEEDDIRRGVFSHVLRNLARASPEQKQVWQAAIEEVQQALRSRTAAAGTEGDSAGVEDVLVEEGEHVGKEILSSGTVAESGGEEKAEMEASRTLGGPTPKLVLGKKRERSDEDEGAAGLSAGNADSHEDPVHSSSSTSGAAGFSIGSFLHSQVEKTVGSTLNVLSVSTLRVLCMILGIDKKTRSKEALYHTLASYHFTHCEVLGKRISRSTIVDELARQDAMSVHLFLKQSQKGPGATHKKETPAISEAPMSEVVAAPRSLDTSQAEKPSSTTPTTSVSSTAHRGHSTRLNTAKSVAEQKAAPPQKQKKASLSSTRGSVPSSSSSSDRSARENFHSSQPHLQREIATGAAVRSDPSHMADLSIAYPEPALRRAAADSFGSAFTASARSLEAQEDTEWTSQKLEKSIATIVRNFDPVTTTIVIKKLAKMGYTAPEAKSVVESCLKSFHEKKYIYFESGIAYCLD